MEKRRSHRRKKSPLPVLVAGALFLIAFVIIFILVIKPFADRSKNSAASQSLSRSVATSISSASLVGSDSSSTAASTSSSSSTNNTTWLNTVNENKLPTLMYHNISPNTPNNNYVSPENLENSLQALLDGNIYTVSSGEAYKILTTNTKPADKLIWLTFDDGYQDFYDHVFPLLKKYKMHATSFLITAYIKEAKPGYLTEAEVKEMAQSGYVDFQSHTVNHADLSVTSDTDQTSELQDSKDYIDKLLNQNTTVICYPSGSHNASTPTIAGNLGYKLGLLDPGRTYNGLKAVNAAAKSSDGLFLLNRYRTFTNFDGSSLMSTIADDETYNMSNTQK